jgi:hypothetical protein
MAVANTEVSPDRYSVSVSYNTEEQIATVLFRVTQNANGGGTIDPSHIEFAFSGNDVLGLKISDQADEYSGFSGFARSPADRDRSPSSAFFASHRPYCQRC